MGNPFLLPLLDSAADLAKETYHCTHRVTGAAAEPSSPSKSATAAQLRPYVRYLELVWDSFVNLHKKKKRS